MKLSTKTHKTLGVAAVGTLMVLAAGSASARDNFSLGINLGGPAYYSPPVVVRPAAYYPAPVQVAYEPAYYRPVYYGGYGWHRGWEHRRWEHERWEHARWDHDGDRGGWRR